MPKGVTSPRTLFRRRQKHTFFKQRGEPSWGSTGPAQTINSNVFTSRQGRGRTRERLGPYFAAFIQ
jgi:hypothetical protein